MVTKIKMYLKDDKKEVLLFALGGLHFLLQPLDLLLQLTLLILTGFVHVLIIPAVPLNTGTNILLLTTSFQLTQHRDRDRSLPSCAVVSLTCP